MHWMFIDYSSVTRWLFIDYSVIVFLTIHWLFIAYSLIIHWLLIDYSLIAHWLSIDNSLSIRLIIHWEFIDYSMVIDWLFVCLFMDYSFHSALIIHWLLIDYSFYYLLMIHRFFIDYHRGGGIAWHATYGFWCSGLRMSSHFRTRAVVAPCNGNSVYRQLHLHACLSIMCSSRLASCVEHRYSAGCCSMLQPYIYKQSKQTIFIAINKQIIYL